MVTPFIILHMIYIILPLIVIIPSIALALTRKNFLLCLLNLEAITLGLLIVSTIVLSIQSQTESLTPLLILSLGACEARLGLACLVKITRTYGRDTISSINAIKC